MSSSATEDHIKEGTTDPFDVKPLTNVEILMLRVLLRERSAISTSSIGVAMSRLRIDSKKAVVTKEMAVLDPSLLSSLKMEEAEPSPPSFVMEMAEQQVSMLPVDDKMIFPIMERGVDHLKSSVLVAGGDDDGKMPALGLDGSGDDEMAPPRLAEKLTLKHPQVRTAGPTGHDLVAGSDDEDSQGDVAETAKPYLPLKNWIDKQMIAFPDGDVAKRAALFASFSERFVIMQANGTEITEEDRERMMNRFSDYSADMIGMFDAAHRVV